MTKVRHTRGAGTGHVAPEAPVNTLLVLLLGCEEPPPDVHHLSDLFRPYMVLNTGHEPGAPEQVQLYVHPVINGPCHPIPSLVATLDGRPLTRQHGEVMFGARKYDRDCALFEFTLEGGEVVVGETNEVKVTDGVTTFRMAVGGAFTPRRLSLVSRTGDDVVLGWTPATDVVAPKGDFGVELVAGGRRVVVARKDITFGPGTLAFRLPAGLEGAIDVSVVGTSLVQPAVTACEGAHSCEVSRLYTVEPLRIDSP